MYYHLKSLGRFKRKPLKTFYLVNKFTSKSDVQSSWKVIFFGTDQLSERTLKALNLNRLCNDAMKVVHGLEIVCTKSDCAVRRYAALHNLTIHTWPFEVPANKYDVGVVVSFGHMISSSSIEACKYGIINAHPSLLPRWRGASPIFYTVLNGDKETGVTITQVSPNKFDVGNILMQKKYTVPERCTTHTLLNDLGNLAADMVIQTLKKLPFYIESSYPQPVEGATLARKIKPENCSINWNNDSSLCVDRKFRAYNGFFDLYTHWKDIKIVILDVVSPQETKEVKLSDLVGDSVNPGFCYFHKKRKIVYVKCQDGWCGIKMMKIPRTGKISASDFYNGFMTKVPPDQCYFV